MKDQLDTIQKEFETRIASVSGLDRLDELKVAYLGKKGALTALLKGMGQLSPEERPAAGQLVNQVRAYIEQSIAEKAEELKAAALRLKLEQEAVDVTMPGKARRTGSLHPIHQISDEMKDLFIGMGYEIADGPEIEFDYYNFEALNLPEGHPARHTRHLLHYGQNAAQNADLLGADPCHGTAEASDKNHLPRKGIPRGQRRRDTLSDFPPDRRPGGRQGRYDGRSQGNARGLREAHVRTGNENPSAAASFSVYRAERGS